MRWEVVLENILVGGIDPPVPRDEAVELLTAFFPKSKEGAEACFRDLVLLDLEGLHQGIRVAVEVAGVAVVVPHEGLRSAEYAALRVFESGGDDSLELEGEDVRGLFREW